MAVACSVNTGVERPPADGADVDPATPVERYLAADFKADYVAAACGWYARCGGALGDVFADRATCASLIGFTFAADVNETGSFEEPLLFRVDPAQAADCVRAIEAQPCGTPAPEFGSIAACVAGFVGRLSDGECCDRRGGCAPGLVCEMGDAGNIGIGYCTAVGAPGETCATQGCAAPATCERFGSSGFPTCVVSLQLGVGEDCDYTFDCGPGLSCQIPNGGERGECLARAEAGDQCRPPDQPCSAGLFCVGDASVTRCSSTPGAEGQVCYVASDCAAGLSCSRENSSNAVCVRLGAAGDACSDDPAQACEDGLGCINGTCGAFPVPLAYGDPCHPEGPRCPNPFGDNACSDQGDGFVCVRPGGENDPCGGETDPQCDLASGFVCDPASGTCRKLPVTGETCQAGLCFPFFTVTCVGEGAAAVCQARKPQGSACNPTPDELDNFFATECEFFAFCLPDPATGATTCQRLTSEGETRCE